MREIPKSVKIEFTLRDMTGSELAALYVLVSRCTVITDKETAGYILREGDANCGMEGFYAEVKSARLVI